METNNKVLVTYASRFGTAAGVAEAIGNTLRDCGDQVDVLPMSEVTELAAYQAVVAGSAINGGYALPRSRRKQRQNPVDHHFARREDHRRDKAQRGGRSDLAGSG